MLGTPAAASAHATLLSTTPTQSARYSSASGPRTVALVFDNVVTTSAETLGVYDGRGKPVHVALLRGSGKTVRGRLPRLVDGSYVVVWHIISDDGHPEQGAFTFSVGRAAASTVDIGSLVASRSAGRGLGTVFGIDRVLIFLATLVVVGGLAFIRWRWPEARNHRAVWVVLLALCLVGVIASLVSIPLQAAYTTGGGAGTVTDWSAFSAVTDVRFGRAALARALLLGLLAVFIVAKPGRVRSWLDRDVIFGVIALATLVSIAYAGHGYTGQWPLMGLAIDVAHLGAASGWLGGLVVLALALRSRTGTASLAVGAERFSQVALPAVAILVLSGVLQGWRQLASVSALWHTSYGRLLVLKGLVVIAIVVIASAGRDALRDRRTAESAGQPVSDHATASLFTELRRGVWTEAGLAVVVLGLTSALVVSPPGREAVAAARRPTATTVNGSANSRNFSYRVAVQPALVGTNTIVVSPSLTSSSGFLPATLTGTLQGASGKQGALTFTPIEGGRWVTTAQLPRAGTWTLTLSDATPPATDTASLQVTVR